MCPVVAHMRALVARETHGARSEALIGGGARLQVKSHEGWRDKGGERKLVVVVAKQRHSVEDT